MRDGHTRVQNTLRVDPARPGRRRAGPAPVSGPRPIRGPGRSAGSCWSAGMRRLGLALLVAAVLRNEFRISDIDLGPLLDVVLIAIAAQLVIGGKLQTYRGRHCAGSVEDAINVTSVTVLAGSIGFLINFFGAATAGLADRFRCSPSRSLCCTWWAAG